MAIIERILFKVPVGFVSRLKVLLYKFLGISIGKRNRFESGRCRRLSQIEIGNYNAFSHGYQLWPEDSFFEGKRIKVGDKNYFNRNLMVDACGYIEIGSYNMFGPDVYITDSNHKFGAGISPSNEPMQKGKVRIGDYCWIGAKAIILKDVELGNHCVVAAGAVVTKSFGPGSVVAGVPAKLIKTTE